MLLRQLADARANQLALRWRATGGVDGQGHRLRAVGGERPLQRTLDTVGVEQLPTEPGSTGGDHAVQSHHRDHGRVPTGDPRGQPVGQLLGYPNVPVRQLLRIRIAQLRTPERNFGTRMLTLVPAPSAVSTTKP